MMKLICGLYHGSPRVMKLVMELHHKTLKGSGVLDKTSPWES